MNLLGYCTVPVRTLQPPRLLESLIRSYTISQQLEKVDRMEESVLKLVGRYRSGWQARLIALL